MDGLTDFITRCRWSDIITAWYVLVDDANQALLTEFSGWRTRGAKPRFSDSEVITIGLIADTFFAGDESKALWFVRQYHLDMFPLLPANGQFNYRRRLLSMITEQIRTLITLSWQLFDPEDSYRLTDSAPIPVCTYTRAKQNKTLCGVGDRRDYFGVIASKKAKLFGFRLHLSTSTDQVLDSWLLAPASVHDSNLIDGMSLYEGQPISHLVMLADGAFNNPGALGSLRHKHGQELCVWALPRRDARTPWPAEFRRVVGRMRRRVETALSVLTTVFNIEQPRSRSLTGLISRVATRMLAYTLCFIVGPILALSPSFTQN
jgi:hypothetical protein